MLTSHPHPLSYWPRSGMLPPKPTDQATAPCPHPPPAQIGPPTDQAHHSLSPQHPRSPLNPRLPSQFTLAASTAPGEQEGKGNPPAQPPLLLSRDMGRGGNLAGQWESNQPGSAFCPPSPPLCWIRPTEYDQAPWLGPWYSMFSHRYYCGFITESCMFRSISLRIYPKKSNGFLFFTDLTSKYEVTIKTSIIMTHMGSVQLCKSTDICVHELLEATALNRAMWPATHQAAWLSSLNDMYPFSWIDRGQPLRKAPSKTRT